MDETFSVEIPSTVKLLPAKPRPAVVSPMPVKDPLRRNFLLFIIFILLIKGKESVEVWEYGSMGVLGRIFIPILSHFHTFLLFPSAAKRSVQFHTGIQFSPLNKCQAQLSIEGRLLGCDDFQVIGHIIFEQQLRIAHGSR